MPNKKNTVIVQAWEESEAGWGTRPDGCSLHLTDEDREAYIKAYWDRMPNATPSEYSRPDGTPYTWDTDEETYARVKASENGIRKFRKAFAGSDEDGTDGWGIPRRPSESTSR